MSGLGDYKQTNTLTIKRRYFLHAGTALVGTLCLSFYSPRRSKKMSEMKDEFEITKPEAEWRELLTPEQFYILRKHGTERAGSSPLDKQYDTGTYVCAACRLPLFTSDTKFNSGTGWPSFYAPIEGAIGTTIDRTLFMVRTEVHCHRCGGHLGHVFEDGPQPTGQRYCMNGVALDFIAS